MKGKKNEDGTPNTFCYQNFEVRGFFSYDNKFDRITANRIRNCFVTALNEHAALPKVVVVVMDDNVLTDFDELRFNVTCNLEIMIKWIMREFEHILLTYKEYLPTKAKRANFPHVLWIAPPQHKNFSYDSNQGREKFTESMEFAVQQRKDMSCLKLVKIWDFEDGTLYKHDRKKFSAKGFSSYWGSVDSAVRYWHTAIMPKIGKKSKPGQATNRFQQTHHRGKPWMQKDKYKWRRQDQVPQYMSNDHRRLPTPT